MRIWQGSGQEELECLVIRNSLVSELDDETRTLLDFFCLSSRGTQTNCDIVGQVITTE